MKRLNQLLRKMRNIKKYIDRERRRIRMQKKSIIKNNLEREIPKDLMNQKGNFIHQYLVYLIIEALHLD